MPVLKHDRYIQGCGSAELQKLFGLQIDLFATCEEVAPRPSAPPLAAPIPAPAPSPASAPTTAPRAPPPPALAAVLVKAYKLDCQFRGPLRRPAGLASMIRPVTGVPEGTTVKPANVTLAAVVAWKESPAFAVLVLIASVRRIGMAVPWARVTTFGPVGPVGVEGAGAWKRLATRVRLLRTVYAFDTVEVLRQGLSRFHCARCR